MQDWSESTWMIRWIGVCAKLHNYVMNMNDPWIEDDSDIDLEVELDIPCLSMSPSIYGQAVVGVTS